MSVNAFVQPRRPPRRLCRAPTARRPDDESWAAKNPEVLAFVCGGLFGLVPSAPTFLAAPPDELSRAITYVEEGDEQVCYLMKEETQKLLHLPEHVFKLLTAHALDEHADRNMATHLVQFTRARGIHLLVSAHPLFRHSAFIMGNANEPPKGSPSLELLELKLVLATDDDPLMQRAGLKQDPISLKMFDVFEEEHPEILMRSTFFVTRKEGSCFKEAEELTVVYGNQYKRTYSTWGLSLIHI